MDQTLLSLNLKHCEVHLLYITLHRIAVTHGKRQNHRFVTIVVTSSWRCLSCKSYPVYVRSTGAAGWLTSLFTMDNTIYCSIFLWKKKMQISLILEDKSITCTEEIVPVNASLDTQERKTMSCAAGKWDTFPVENCLEIDMLPFFVGW